MDLCSEDMYDIFKGEVWKELGPVDPNWFEILTAQAPIIEETVTDRDDLCANQEGNFKIPLDKAAADTQLFSTPKVFRRSQIVSPDTEDEQSFTAPQEKGTLPWMVTQSPCLFQDSKVGDPGVKCGGFQSQNDNSFELLNTPKKSPVSYAQHISESLGAQINPDISWTSSLNTPPALPSTLILSKADDESPCPASVTADRNVVFVRKLFPSLSKESTVMETKNKNKPAVSQGAGNCGVHESPQTTLNQSEGIWQQKVPDANEDEELQSTEAGVLDGAENVPSMLFANSNSALRKVKPDRIKRRQSIQTEENDCSSKDVSTTHSEEVTSDVEPGTFSSSPPVKTGDTAVSQWSPLNLSEIPACTVENNILTEKLQGNTDSNQPARPLVKITESVFIRKKRKFVYTVGTLKPQVQGEEPHSQKMDLLKMPESGQDVTIKQLKKAPNEADCCNTGKSAVKKQLKLHGENLLQSAEVKVQGLDMSQLCRDFAQDFSQVSDSDDQVKVAEDIQHDFSPSACLSAMKQAKQKARQADLHRSYDGTSHGKTSTSNQNTCEHAINDSGFHSAVLNTTHMTTSSYGLPCSENTGQSREWSGFKADSHITAPSLFTKKENEKVHLDAGAEPTLMSGQRKQTQVLGEKSESHTESTSTQQPISTKGAADNMYRAPINGQIHPHLPEKTAASLPSGYASGFKTASNKGIQISSANLERAKRLFEETEGAKTFIDQSTKCDRATKYKTCMSNGSVKSTTAETSSSQLTASQRADVTELCSLLEEADSQFEFTQFKTAKVKEHCQYGTNSPKKMDKEIDPDFLAGIDFDDSFNSDAEDHLKVNVMPNSKHIAECERCPNHLYRAEHSEAAKLEKSATLMLDVAFKTAGENVLRVSKKCLNKARTLFADLEKSPTEKSPNNQNNEMEEKFNMDSNMCKKDLKFTLKDDHHVGRKIQNVEESVCSNKQVTGFGDDIKSLRNSKIDTTICQSGFHMASGKQISISAKYMQQADALFKDCDVMDCNDGTSNKKSIKHVAESVESKKSISKFNNLESNISEEQVKRFKRLENANAELAAHHTDEPHVDKVEIGSNCSLALKNAASLHRNTCSSLRQTTSKNIDSSVVEWSSGDGFCTASGKKVSVSAVSMKMAECLLGEIHTPVDTKREPDQIEKTSRTEQLTAQVLPPKNSGFQTASAKEVTISEAALKKAKTLFQECEELEDKSSALPPLYKVKVTGPPVMNSGFSTASGKAVAFSSEALQKAKALFSDTGLSTDIPAVSDTTRSVKKHEDAQDNIKIMDCGFKTAGGAAVRVSQKNLLKAKHLLKEFDDLVLSKEIQEAGSFFKGYDKDGGNAMLARDKKAKVPLSKGDSEEKPLAQLNPNQRMTVAISEQHGNKCTEDTNKPEKLKESTLSSEKSRFQTASGKVVALSPKALKKAKAWLNECARVEDKVGAAPLHPKVTALPFSGGGFHSASGKPETLQKAESLLSDISFSAEIPDVSHTKTSDKSGDVAEKRHLGFTTAGGAKVHVSQKSLLKAKHFFQNFDISASAKAAQEAGPFEEPGNGSTMDMIRQVKQKEDTFLQQNGGFQTAGGKAVAVSSQALMRAKTMLSGYEGGENEMGVLLPQVRNTVTGPFLERSGFSAASGKPVAFSSEALQKAKALFSDISLHTDKPAVSDTRRSDKKHEDAQNITEKIHSGFTTAGRGVHVSEESLFKTGNLLREFAGGECHYSDSNSTSPRDLQKLDLSKVKDVKRTSNSGVPGVRNEEIPAKRETSSEVTPFSLHEINQLNKTVDSFGVQGSSFIKDKTLTDVFTHQEDKIVPLATTHLHISSGPVKSHVVDCDITERSEVECSDLNLQSVNLTGCTETQQKFLAQEALDCTKALLEDESLAGQSLSVTSENRSLQDDPKVSNRSPEEENRTRKRIMGDADLISQPPLKRRLLEEFDRTVDGAKASVLHPVKSCPNGLMKDRGVFKYNTSLQPNITKPHRDEKRYIDIKFQKTTPTDGSATGGSRSSHFKMPAFVPPLIKNTKPVTQKIPALKENASTPVFIPPFKKQRTVLEESISQQQDEEDKCQQISQSHSNTHVPPSKKLQGTTHDAANNSLMNNQGVLVDCQSVSSGAEASHVDDAFSRSQDVDQNLENIELARDMQDMRIRKKKRQTIRPLPGSLFLTKTSGVMRIPLKVAVNGKPPTRCTSEQLYEYGVQRHVSEVRSESAESFRFNLLQFIRQETLTDGGGVQLADGGWLIPSNDWTAGKEEFYRALCDTPGVDPKLISEAWVYNHYRWIVWKQASMEKSFPETMGSFCLTPEQVLLQLKYRYDVEVDHSRRPALRKIMEKDDTAAKTIVLCVSEIVSRGQSPEKQSCNNKTPQTADAKVETLAVVWLTDGWYAIKAQLDEPLTAMLHKGLLAVGGKLIINGAQLVGSQDACSPLEAPESLMLKICANSCRRARWNAKLGFHRDPRPFLLPISSFYSNGGPVGCVDIVMLRSYPIQWMERKPDGSVVFRSTRAEEKEARQYDNHKHKAMEVLFAKIQAEFEKEKGNIKPQRRKQVSHQNIRSLQDGEELYEAIGDDPADLEAHLSEQQLEIFHSYRRSLMEKKHAELQDRYRRAVEAEDNDMNCPKRDVSPVWRISIADSLAQPSCVYQLNLWQPSADLRSLLKEGSRYKVYNLITSDGKKRSSIHTIQLTGTKKTQFQDLQASREWLLARFQPRVSTNFVNLQNTEFQPLCGEVDLTGYVISVIDGQGSSPAFYLADEKLNFVKVRCFSSLSQAGLEDVVKPCVLLALSNLQLRGQSIHPTPVVYAGDLTVFSTNPKEVHLQESFSHLKNLVQCQENFFLKAEDKLSHLVRSDGLSSISLALLPQTPTSTTDRRQDSKTSVTHQKPIRNLGSFTPVNRNPPAGTSSTKKDPVNLKRRRALDYLSRIPSPPPLSLLGSLASPTVNKTFNPPRRSGTPSTLKNAPTPIKKPTDSLVEDEWVNDEELAMIDTQALHGGDLK
ncbi:breast cancer type 2 susceptibility protein isoform X1 [Melanotaenia boesemani]|uniref:breast cancer type 2 susceptibility protein isoform X1 n=1 Tax=Melanotaenia boesemani TaxID=1250792 RepID=UPI001C03B7AE|nr:breast cancer type 2 susceptibility protein isoform X1 [Melanotaenia boesemani]